MKKSKLLIPFVSLAGLASAITPMVFATSCSNPGEKIGEAIPTKYLDITPSNVLVGLKGNADLSNCTKLIVPATVEAIAPYAFWKSKLPAKVETVIFETPEVSTTEDIPMSACAEIGPYAFYGTKVKEVQLANGIRTIGAFAFSHSAVEHCNFPFTLQAIEEEAYSFSNIKEVIFNERRVKQSKRGIDIGNPFWFGGRGDDQGQIVVETMPDGTEYYDIVSYVGERAFFNCQHLTYHRATNSARQLPQYHYGTIGPYQQTVETIIDSSGEPVELRYGPFACYDYIGNIGQSKIKILDWSLFDNNNKEAIDSGQHKWPGEVGESEESDGKHWTDIFGFKINGWEGKEEPRRFVIFTDPYELAYPGDEGSYWRYMHEFFDSFHFTTAKGSPTVSAQEYLTAKGPTFNNAEFALNNYVGDITGGSTNFVGKKFWPNCVWNFSIIGHESKEVNLGAKIDDKKVGFEFRNFWANAKGSADDVYFPMDVKPIIKSITWNDGKPGPNINVQMDSSNPKQVNFTWNDEDMDALIGRQATIELEVSTQEAHRSWTYGLHEEDGYNDSIIIKFQ